MQKAAGTVPTNDTRPKIPLSATSAIKTQTTPRKRSRGRVEVVDLTEGDSPPKCLRNVPVNLVPTQQSTAQALNVSSDSAHGVKQSVAKRKLKLQLDEIRLKEERIMIKRQLLELESEENAAEVI